MSGRTQGLLGGLMVTLAAGWAQAAPTLRLCTGAVGNQYHELGMKIAEQVKGEVAVAVVPTKGSWENLERIDTEPPSCDAIIAQDDAWALYQFEKPKSALMMDRVAVTHPEYVHLICNQKANVTRAAQLDPKVHTLVLNGFGSGTYITWGLIARLNPKYRDIRTVTATSDEALTRVGANQAPMCLLMVMATGGRTLTAADTAHGDVLRLVELDDDALHRRVGHDKRPVYAKAEIPAGAYQKLATDAVVTQRVDAVFFVNPEWRARHPEAAASLTKALAASK